MGFFEENCSSMKVLLIFAVLVAAASAQFEAYGAPFEPAPPLGPSEFLQPSNGNGNGHHGNGNGHHSNGNGHHSNGNGHHSNGNGNGGHHSNGNGNGHHSNGNGHHSNGNGNGGHHNGNGGGSFVRPGGNGGNGGYVSNGGGNGGGYPGSGGDGGSGGIEQYTPKTFRHVYVHVAPDEPEDQQARTLRIPGGDKHVNIIFVKTPSTSSSAQTELILPPQDEQKNLVYVLLKKAEASSDIKIRRPQAKRPQKPEVYFIRYKGQDDKKNGNGNGGYQNGGGSNGGGGRGYQQQPETRPGIIRENPAPSYGAPF